VTAPLTAPVAAPVTSPVLGIDFGTSNSAAAYMDASGQLQEVPLGQGRAEMPTALFFDAETHTVLYGHEAMQAYLSGAEGRLLRALKSLLGSPLMDEVTSVNGEAMRFFDIVVLFFKELKRRSEAHVGQPITHAVLGRPVHFVDEDPARDAQAQDALGRAARQAGFTDFSFQLEPIAAALDHEQRLTGETTVLVVDIGGGTSDFTVIRLHPARSRQVDRTGDILATTGVHIGGTNFDRLLDLDQVMPLMGYRHADAVGRPVPSSVFFDLSTWHLIHQAYSRKSMLFAQSLGTHYANRQLHARLMDALHNQHGHRLLAGVESAKIACSQTGQPAQVLLDYLLPDPPAAGVAVQPLSAWLEAEALARALQPALEPVVACAQLCVQRSGLNHVDEVVLTGGSSALRPLVDALQQAMPEAKLVAGNRFGGVAAGLAVTGFNS